MLHGAYWLSSYAMEGFTVTIGAEDHEQGDIADYDSKIRKIYREVYVEIEQIVNGKTDGSTEGRLQHANEILFDLFSCITDPNSTRSERFPFGSPTRWYYLCAKKRYPDYPNHLEMIEESKKYGINSEGLRDAVNQYLACPWMHTKFLDWFCASTLAYSEYIGYADKCFLTRLDVESWVMLHNSKLALSDRLSKVRKRRLRRSLGKWVVWIALVYGLGILSGVIGPLILVVITILWVRSRIREEKKLDEVQDRLLDAMQKAYLLFEPTGFSWKMAYDDLYRARELGAVWPSELWRLVEAKGGMA